jgi:hypothetical protein
MGEPLQLTALPEGNTWLKLWFSSMTTKTCCELGKPDCAAGVEAKPESVLLEVTLLEDALPEDTLPVCEGWSPEVLEPAGAAGSGEALA